MFTRLHLALPPRPSHKELVDNDGLALTRYHHIPTPSTLRTICTDGTLHGCLVRMLDAGMHPPFYICPTMPAASPPLRLGAISVHTAASRTLARQPSSCDAPLPPDVPPNVRRRVRVHYTHARSRVATAAHAADPMRALRRRASSPCAYSFPAAPADEDPTYPCREEHVEHWRGGMRRFVAEFADGASMLTDSVTVCTRRSWLNYITRLPTYDLHIVGNNVRAPVPISAYPTLRVCLLCRYLDGMLRRSSVRI